MATATDTQTTTVDTPPTPDLSTEIENYLKENPDFLKDFLNRNQAIIPEQGPTDPLQSILDQLTESYPFTIPDTQFQILGFSLTPYDIAGILVPVICLLLLLLFMRNCYGYMGMYLWITVILGWYSLTTFFPKLELPFQKQIHLLLKYILILFSAIFLLYTAFLLGLQILSLPFKGIGALFQKSTESVAQVIPPVQPQPQPMPIPTTTRQLGGARKYTKPPAAFLYVPPSH